MNRYYFKLALTFAFIFALPLGWAFAQQGTASTTPHQTPVRFDHEVRTDFFAGYTGNKEALQRGMAKCEAKLTVEPDHPEALVWHGGGLMFQATEYFAKQDFNTGIALYQRGQAEMDRAVQLRPKDISILVPRAALLVSYSRHLPNPAERQQMLSKVISDYEEVYRQQQPFLARLSAHARGELLMGLAEAYLRSGDAANRAKAHALLQQLQTDEAYAKEAKNWLQTPNDAPAKTFTHQCIGCHT